MNDDLMKKLALLQALKGEADADDDDGDDAEMFISSVKDAMHLLKTHMGPSGARYRKRLVDYLTNHKNRVMIEPDVYHNFIMALFRAGDYDAAVRICDFILYYAPKNMDILADALKACGDSCQFELGEKYLARAEEIDKKLWSWRLFLYGTDFLKTKLQAYPDDEKLFARAKALAERFMENFPADEHGYNQYAELLVCVNETEAAIDTLYRFITMTAPEERPGSRLVCAQCCVTLLNLMDDSNHYSRIVEICDRGMACTTQEQPSASIGFFIYRKALALDAMASDEMFRVPDTISNALKCYQAAYDLCQDRDYANTIEQRYALLRIHVAPENFVPLIKRPLYVEESKKSEEK